MADGQISLPVGASEAHASHPSVPNLMLLVFSAILEVVCTSLPGYVLARLNLFGTKQQKFLAELNIMLFTPCLIFSKLASQLSFDKLRDLAIIPAIFIIQTLVSWLCAVVVSRLCGLKRRPQNFVTAMAVFGNSNSLPISLVLSLSHTLSGLHWAALPHDSDGAVAGRGILYLLLFQQLGQGIRWSWGYHSLLKPKSKYPEYRDEVAEEGGQAREQEYTDDGEGRGSDGEGGDHGGRSGTITPGREALGDDMDHFSPAGQTPTAGSSRGSPAESEDEAGGRSPRKPAINVDGVAFPHTNDPHSSPEHFVGTFKAAWMRKVDTAKTTTWRAGSRLFDRLPKPVQRAADALENIGAKTYRFLHTFMNPPLWAMLVAVLVASVPQLQGLFFGEGFVKNSVTTAVQSMGGVAVPLILVVLGANLAGKTQGMESRDKEEAELGTRLLVASLVCRMVLPPLVMGPVLGVFVKFVPVSILGDPIFVIVNFLLMGAPSALQLAQICQLNEVYEGVMAKILFHSYVIWILPVTMALVMGALEVVEWAAR